MYLNFRTPGRLITLRGRFCRHHRRRIGAPQRMRPVVAAPVHRNQRHHTRSRSAPDGWDARRRRTGEDCGLRSRHLAHAHAQHEHGHEPPSTGAAAAPVSGDAVAIKNFAFAPATLKVKVGTTVTWTNQDTDAHTVTSTGSGGPLRSAALNTHATYSYTFTKPGTYSYLCTIHPFMTATVEVTR